MRRTVSAASCTLAGWAILALPVLAQGPAGPGTLSPGAGALIIDQSSNNQPPGPPKPGPAPRLPTTETAGQSAPQVALKRVRFDSKTRLDARIGAIAAPYIGKPLESATIKAVADAVSAAYAKTGLALYTIAVPRQDLSGGTLTLKAVEGYVADVTYAGNLSPKQSRLVRAYAARITRERPLTRATLERSLSLMRDIPGLTVDAQLYNTTAPGAVRLALKLKQTWIRPELGFNNFGNTRLGVAQAQLSVSANSLISQGDQAKLTLSAPTDVDRFQYAALAYTSPIGSNGLTVQGDLSYLKTRPTDPPIDGDAAGAGVQLSYPLIRRYNENLYLSGGLDGLNSDNAIYGQSITSDHTRALRASLNYARTEPKRTYSFSAVVSQGVGILGAHADARLTDGDFRKATLQGAFNQTLGATWAVRLKAISQISDGRLPAAEQLPLGGEGFGRAFYSAEVVGDYGYAGSAELGWADPKPWPTALKGSELFGFIDGGKTFTRARLPYVAAQEYDLASAGFGVRFLLHKKLVIGLEAAKSIDAPYPGQSKPWRAVISWRTLL